MSTLIANPPRRGTSGLLVLRLGVAAILAWAGSARLSNSNSAVVPESAPPVLSDSPITQEMVTQAKELLTPDVLATSDESATDTSKAVTKDGVKLDLGWREVFGFGELVVAGMLLLGFFTRFVTLVGAGTVATSGLAAFDKVNLPEVFEPLVSAFQSNPVAALLLGVVFLALFVGGSGPGAIDGAMKRRRQRREGSSSATELAA